ncbi:MAG TPA: DUF4384 domain-containing protein [Oscillatoriales cyanobacterium M59_W2019_021]|nr:DUF4384 domain-containing protein [Oscillatoriales cyanobacterium M4454_W2019_049]HIK52761.1 DUF4384 domain-containing protein [Oscillatoriales cyanobacterium M59_W2019_021]
MGDRGSIEATGSNLSPTSTLPRYPSGTTLQIQVENRERDLEIYLSVLVISASGDIDILYPAEWVAPEEAARIDPNNTLTVPRPDDRFELTVQGSSGFPEVLILTSTEPLRTALQGLQAIARSRNVARGAFRLRDDEAVDILGFILGDLNQISRSLRDDGTVVVPTDAIAYETSVMAVLSAVLEVGG